MGVVIIRGERAFLGVNLGHPIATNGTLLHSCAEVCEPIKLLFGVVSGVGRGMGVLDGGPHDPSGRCGFGGLASHSPPLV